MDLSLVIVSVSLWLSLHAAIGGVAAVPTIQLDRGVFIGNSTGTVDKFLGIPFALPPTGDRRFRLPEPNHPYEGAYNATVFGNSCPQQTATPTIPNEIVGEILSTYILVEGAHPQSEDCLSLNVWAPANTTADANLPVLAWIYGGGWEVGETATYNGEAVVQGSLNIGMPIIYVSMNYRLAAFGFLASREVKEAGVGNLGLHDQRQALRWIQTYIGTFGGDKDRVTIWGESAGSVSVALQMITNGGNSEGLFHGAFMQSGSPLIVGDITHGQPYYDLIVNEVGCNGTEDTLQCLREAPYEKFQAASSSTPSLFSNTSLNLVWMPRTDGKFLTEDPQTLVKKGHVADIPFVNGDCDDEGTLFSLSSLNATSDEDTLKYIQSVYYPKTSSQELDPVLQLYSSDPSEGSPFNTSSNNTLSPQYKRIAAIQGDIWFQGPRRLFFEYRSEKQNTWSYLYKGFKSTPFLGSFHSSDLIGIYGPGSDLGNFVIRFATGLDPNHGNTTIYWPRYTQKSRKLMTILDGSVPLTIGEDDFREEGIKYLTQLMLQNPL
ncbi:Esterase/Lipase [Heterobasidion irregulare TC 32-1]|uniref:Carboxylic ester hydrolase n=1 Tax=Heterobasidion irregulare (strain TC 32-1) TaxID=747525 RepID=W4K8Q2_HETIT|nr:Esterase/Lipase [Heterobasidion irregulare TC 32-1]ETW82212.1 Esterase/Lipase [Heterobasidion irregulare TC 32-1]